MAKKKKKEKKAQIQGLECFGLELECTVLGCQTLFKLRWTKPKYNSNNNNDNKKDLNKVSVDSESPQLREGNIEGIVQNNKN